MPQKRIAEIEEHKVKTGESIKSLAEANGMTWQELAKFNWDTDVPDEINKHLRDEVGCTKKTRDGYNYMFDNSDDPGIIYLPKSKDWKESGLQTDKTHTLRVRKITPVVVDLVIPLEIDLDDDPSRDDQIRLRALDGTFQQTLVSSDPRVEQSAEHPLLLYGFKDVPIGAYTVEVRIGNEWYEVLRELRVSRDSATVHGEPFVSTEDGSQFGKPDVEPETIDDPDAEDGFTCSC
jgi:hypothetical protein